MKYKNCNSFIQYFNIFHEKKKKKKWELHCYGLNTSQLGTHPTINHMHYSTFKNESHLIDLKEMNNI